MIMVKAGAAEIDITPCGEVTLGGSFELRRAVNVHEPLLAASTVIETGGKKILFLSCDLLLLSDDQAAELQERVSRATGVPRENTIINCTHTHNAPSMLSLFPLLPVDGKLVRDVMGKIVRCAQDACDSARPARIGYARGSADNATFNRRYIMRDGVSVMHPARDDSDRVGPEGPADPDLSLIWFEDTKNDYISLMVNFSAHPTLLFGEPVISSDFPGCMRKTVKSVIGDVPVLYLQGACGNTSPVNIEDESSASNGFETCRRIGMILGGEIIKLLAENYTATGKSIEIRNQSKELSLPLREVKSGEVREAMKKLDSLDRSRGNYTDTSVMVDYYYNYSTIKLAEMLGKRKTSPVRLSVIRLNDILIAACSAEIFVEFQLAFKKTSGYSKTIMLELTNGYCGYIPTKRAFDGGGYETRRALSSKFAPGVGDLVVKGILEMANGIRGKKNSAPDATGNIVQPGGRCPPQGGDDEKIR